MGSHFGPVVAARKFPGRFLLFGVTGVALVTAVGAQFFLGGNSDTANADQPVSGRLARQMPAALGLWDVRDEPLGPTEAVRRSTVDILRFDDYVYRRFRRGNVEFSIYVAYWSKGKMPTRLIAEHTPDRCWVENGWRCTKRLPKHQMTVEMRHLQPAERREFIPPGGVSGTQHVLFWLLAGGKAYDFDPHANMVDHAIRWWTAAVREAFETGQPEKLFVRIASNTPFEQLWSDQEFVAMVKALGDLGLWQPNR